MLEKLRCRPLYIAPHTPPYRKLTTVPDIGYPFPTKEAILQDLIELKRDDAAQQLADEVLAQARQNHPPEAEAVVLTLEARIAMQRHAGLQ